MLIAALAVVLAALLLTVTTMISQYRLVVRDLDHAMSESPASNGVDATG